MIVFYWMGIRSAIFLALSIIFAYIQACGETASLAADGCLLDPRSVCTPSTARQCMSRGGICLQQGSLPGKQTISRPPQGPITLCIQWTAGRVSVRFQNSRLQRVRALGFNAIQYYVPWNFHEVYENEYDFSGIRNFTEFTLIAHELGMYSLVRLGPYICGEWENGGLPWWLLNKNISVMRTSEEGFKEAVQKWFSVLLPHFIPLMIHNDGPVLMVQIENEYGSYMACDRNYTIWLRDLVRSYLGKDTVIYTKHPDYDSVLVHIGHDLAWPDAADANSATQLKCGSVPETLTTVDFGPNSEQKINASFDEQKKFLPKGHGPLVNSEFYPGWLVLWGQTKPSATSPEDIVKSADYMYRLNASMNFYMIHGGTNFGFWNGAETNAPCITSYDYFAPISEAGDVTSKYLAIRSWVKSLPDWKTTPLDVPENNPKTAYGTVTLKPMDDLSSPPNSRDCVSSKSPMSFEELGQPFGFVFYSRKMEKCGKTLEVKELKDFGYVYMNGNHLGTFVNAYNGNSTRSVDLTGCTPGDTLNILVENQGRQTFETINDHKGILTDVELDKSVLSDWVQCKLDVVNDYTNFSNTNVQSTGKFGVYQGVFHVDIPTDTFLNTTGWGKGVAIVNGNNLGRYWPGEGPQVTLYVPAPFLYTGDNSLLLLELLGTSNCDKSSCSMSFIDHPIYKWNNTKSASTGSHKSSDIADSNLNNVL